MKKVLIYLHKCELAPTGGPKGYNYNLLQGLKELEINKNPDYIEICYLPGESLVDNLNSKVNSMSNDTLKKMIRVAKSIYNKGRLLYGHNHTAKIDFSDYDAVHFHRTIDLYSAKDSLQHYKGKVILTSHTPTMPAKEIYELLSDFEKKYMSWYYKKLPIIDEFAFDRADYIIFPCEEAEEPYYHEWPGYGEVHNKNKGKYLYMPTGTGEKQVNSDRPDIRKKFHIPEDAFVLCYVGRHNEIKGYGDLKIIGEYILKKFPNTWILNAGKEGPLFHLDHERWIEVGWTNDPGSVIQAADVFILPNRETYFDLIMLEVLSLGQIVLARNTGGNKFFRKYGEPGIILYEDNEQAETEIERILQIKKAELQTYRASNKRLYETHFTNKKFAQNYLSVLERIL